MSRATEIVKQWMLLLESGIGVVHRRYSSPLDTTKKKPAEKKRPMEKKKDPAIAVTNKTLP
jgi:hypothetical protein